MGDNGLCHDSGRNPIWLQSVFYLWSVPGARQVFDASGLRRKRRPPTVRRVYLGATRPGRNPL